LDSPCSWTIDVTATEEKKPQDSQSGGSDGQQDRNTSLGTPKLSQGGHQDGEVPENQQQDSGRRWGILMGMEQKEDKLESGRSWYYMSAEQERIEQNRWGDIHVQIQSLKDDGGRSFASMYHRTPVHQGSWFWRIPTLNQPSQRVILPAQMVESLDQDPSGKKVLKIVALIRQFPA